MQVKLTQDYYGLLRQSLPVERQAGPEQTLPPSTPQRQTVLPAERPVEGELLKNRSRNSSVVGDLLQRGQVNGDNASPDVSPQTAQRAVDTYLAYAGASSAGAAGASRSIDFYA